MGKGERQKGRFVFAGHNLWPALLGKNLTSPRTEVPKILRIIDLSFDLPLHLDLFGSIYDVVIAPEQVIHAVHNSYFNHSLGNWPITAAPQSISERVSVCGSNIILEGLMSP